MTTYDLTTLRDLLVRVEAATGPDWELDYGLFRAFAIPGRSNDWNPSAGNMFTSSIDAAVALIERVLPHSLIGLSNDRTEGWTAKVRLSCGKRMPDPALALLSALLKALIAREERDDQLV